jgi:hypothetical protein
MLKLRCIRLSASTRRPTPLLIEEETQRPIKAVVRHLAGRTSSEDISVVLQELDYDIIIVKQMTAKRPTPEGGVTHVSLPLLLVTLLRNAKGQEIFKLTSLCIVIIKIEV